MIDLGEQIKKENSVWIEEIERLKEEIKALKDRIKNIQEKEIKAPCAFCKYDGVYRCEACKENNYEGFNIADYPKEE